MKDDTDSDNSDEYCHLKYKRTKSGETFYWCQYCGQDDILDVNQHFVNLEKNDRHYIYGSCKVEQSDMKFYNAFR